MANMFEKLFTLVWYVYASHFTRWIEQSFVTQKKNSRLETKKPEDSDEFFEMKQTLKSSRSLDYARVNKSIVYVLIIYVSQQKKTLTGYPAAKHQKHS